MTTLPTRTTKSARRKLAVALLAALVALGAAALAVFAGPVGEETSGEATLNAGKSFTISGSLSSPLVLGGSGQALNLSIRNPHAQTLEVDRLEVTVSGTSTAACGVSNFNVAQTSARPSIPPRSSRTLDQLGATKPRVIWVNTGSQQNACLGAGLTLSYAGKGTLR